MASLDSGSRVESLIPGSGNTYMDLASTFLFMRAKLTKYHGNVLDPSNSMGPVNNWLLSLFNQVYLYLSDTLVIPSTNKYPYRAYMEMGLSCCTETNEALNTSQLRYKDTWKTGKTPTIRTKGCGVDDVTSWRIPSSIGWDDFKWTYSCKTITYSTDSTPISDWLTRRTDSLS